MVSISLREDTRFKKKFKEKYEGVLSGCFYREEFNKKTPMNPSCL